MVTIMPSDYGDDENEWQLQALTFLWFEIFADDGKVTMGHMIRRGEHSVWSVPHDVQFYLH